MRRRQAVVAEHCLPGAEPWGAEADRVFLGFIRLLDDFIGGLFVAPAAQRQGVGRALADHALARKGQRALEVDAAHAAARGFSERLGFVEAGRWPINDIDKPFALIRRERVG